VALSRRNLLVLAGVDVVLFVIANATSKTNNHPGTVSDVAWVLFLFGILGLIVFVPVALVQSRRPRTS
jgi:uncharacterized membrane protein YhaH (DUF805 family)